eukprot:scaffold7726_cov153-Pinguiococcus_pyrenoidosus.AAC.1
MEDLLTTSALRGHICFLQAVREASKADFAAALRRYVLVWLPRLARQGPSGATSGPDAHQLPPADVAWLWHCHRLAPVKYAEYCQSRFGGIVDPGPLTFRFFGDKAAEGAPKGDAEALEGSPGVAASLAEAGATFGAEKGEEELLQQLGYDLREASERQKSFLWQVSGPDYDDEAFLEAALDRYERFLRLMGRYGYRNHFWVPAYDVDLCWHSHMLLSTSRYLTETRELAGDVVDHDDS